MCIRDRDISALRGRKILLRGKKRGVVAGGDVIRADTQQIEESRHIQLADQDADRAGYSAVSYTHLDVYKRQPNTIGIIAVKKFRLFASIINQLLSKKMLATVARSGQLYLQRKLHAPGRVNGIIPLPLSYD